MEVLYVTSSQEWKSLSIEKELLKIAKNKEIKYIVSDQGNNLKKAYKSLNYVHIEDCTHILANYLKRSTLAELKAGEKASIFIQNCNDYLDNLSKKTELLQEDYLLCSSDIIESYFGKFKCKINPNARSGLSKFIFTIANFSKDF